MGKQNEVLANQQGTPVLFDTEKGTVTSFISSLTYQANGKMAERYRTFLSTQEQSQLQDVLYTLHPDSYSCFLFSTSLTCYPNSGDADEFVKIPLKSIKAKQFIYSATTTLLEAETPYLVAHDGFLFKMPRTFRVLKTLAEKDLFRSNVPAYFTDLKNDPFHPSQEYVLGSNGILYRIKRNDKKLEPVQELAQLRFKRIGPRIIHSDVFLPLIKNLDIIE